MNRVRLYLHRLFRRPVITDPMRIYTRRLPDGLALDLEDYFTYVAETIADDDELLGLLVEIAEDRQNARNHKHDGWEPEKLLVEQLATKVGFEVRVRGEALRKLGERLLSAAPKPKPEAGVVVQLPGQRSAGAA
ncbi:hypothetical protein PV733_36670 [Streptomyces europaeiscabiei]|uniref:hypothetical protein n=1 Tax=Streptomyces europaeiscabiei TaxID=146819 RepID=UPI0029A0871A|nr:hypothetical protein [Streptomyces europaeiscabiei]MDX3714365.1 hypothetical protein [Streptomyces europaeiscabiei]